MSRPVFSSAPDRCTQYAPTLLALFDGQTLDIALLELTDARAHLHECALCRKQWRDWELTRDALRATTPHPPAGLRTRVNLAVRLRAPFESVPTPPPGLRDAILRATVGIQSAIERDLSETFADSFEDDAFESDAGTEAAFAAAFRADVETFAPHDTLAAVGTMPSVLPNTFSTSPTTGRVQRKGRAFKVKTMTAWLTPVAAAWLIILSTQGQWGTNRSDIALPTVQSVASLRGTASSVRARASRVLNRLHLGGAARAVVAARNVAAKAADTTPAAPTPADAAEARDTDSASDEQNTPARPQTAPRAEVSEWHEVAHHENTVRRDRSDETSHDDNGPRFQLASWHPTRPVTDNDHRAAADDATDRAESLRVTPPVRIAKAPALSRVPERMNGARGGTHTGLGSEDINRSSSARTASTLPSRGGRRANLSPSARSFMARLNETRFAPTHVVSPQLVSRVSWVSDAPTDDSADAPLRLADHRPAEVSQVVDDFRAALDDEE